MEITDDIFGLSSENSCTHNSPTWIHLKISIRKHGSDRSGWTISSTLSSFHNF
ncbi:hypothetical protein GIB67_018111, partial [Kingdonia uniflora]